MNAHFKSYSKMVLSLFLVLMLKGAEAKCTIKGCKAYRAGWKCKNCNSSFCQDHIKNRWIHSESWPRCFDCEDKPFNISCDIPNLTKGKISWQVAINGNYKRTINLVNWKNVLCPKVKIQDVSVRVARTNGEKQMFEIEGTCTWFEMMKGAIITLKENYVGKLCRIDDYAQENWTDRNVSYPTNSDLRLRVVKDNGKTVIVNYGRRNHREMQKARFLKRTTFKKGEKLIIVGTDYNSVDYGLIKVRRAADKNKNTWNIKLPQQFRSDYFEQHVKPLKLKCEGTEEQWKHMKQIANQLKK